MGAERSPVDCRLAADGVDEALRVMRGYPPEYGLAASPLGPSVIIAVVDGFHTWTVTPMHVTGVDPDGDTRDERLRGHGWADEASVAEIAGSWRPRLLALEPAGPRRDLRTGERGGAGPSSTSSCPRSTDAVDPRTRSRPWSEGASHPRGALAAGDGRAGAEGELAERTASRTWV